MTTPAKPPGLLARLLALFRRPARPRPVRAFTAEEWAEAMDRALDRAELDAILKSGVLDVPAKPARRCH